MVQWSKLLDFGWAKDRRIALGHDAQRLLHDSNMEGVESAYPAIEVTKVALKLKYQIEQIIPCELEEIKITKANSPVLTRKVIHAVKQAGGKDYHGCVVFCLLVVTHWFKRQAVVELWDSDLHLVRAVAAEVLAKKLIEMEEHQSFFMQKSLLTRYSILVNGVAKTPANVIERAVDLHALRVIGSSGYQKCISHLWRGWLVQDELDPSKFVEYKLKANPNYWDHFDPDRMRVPQYQNATQVGLSLIYLVLYTIAINTINQNADIDVIEGILYIFTAGFIADEITKFIKDMCPFPALLPMLVLEMYCLTSGNADFSLSRAILGRYYIGFWNVFNSTLYTLLLVSFIFRMIALGHDLGSDFRIHFNKFSYNFLAFSAPLFWMRLLLYLDNHRFFGTMLVVLKVMMKESLIFFALLAMVCIGFLQAFSALDVIDDDERMTIEILQAMANALMQSPEFSGFDKFAAPFGLILYYIFTFIIMIILLNILIALYNSAYESITSNADDEYMALFASKTMQFVRAPDENVFIAPFNLIELFCLIIPFEWWLDSHRYERLNNYVMGVIYSPTLLITAALEVRTAKRVIYNRKHDQPDDDVVEEWEQLGSGENDANGVDNLDFEADGWAKRVKDSKPNVETGAAVLEVRELKGQIKHLVHMVKEIKDQHASDGKKVEGGD